MRDVLEIYLSNVIVPSNVCLRAGRWPTPPTHMNGNENLGYDLNKSKRCAGEILLLRHVYIVLSIEERKWKKGSKNF